MKCPRCSSEMKLCHGKFGAFWRCPKKRCHYTCNYDGSQPDWENIFIETLQQYCQLCNNYRDNIMANITNTTDPVRGIALIKKYAHDIDADSTIVLEKLHNFLNRPSYAKYRSVLDSNYALVMGMLAKACVKLSNYQQAKRYIAISLKHLHSQDSNFEELYALQSNILLHVAALNKTEEKQLSLPPPEKPVIAKRIPTTTIADDTDTNRLKVILPGIIILLILTISAYTVNTQHPPTNKPSVSSSSSTSSHTSGTSSTHTNTYSKDTEKSTGAVTDSAYVGNSKTRKFHRADCSFVQRMNPSNMVDFDTRENALDKGFIPCQRCKP